MRFAYPDDLQYSDSHEYIRLEADVATIGITAFAIDQLGDVVFIELPPPGAALVKGNPFGTVESVKAVEDINAPISGEVLETNTALVDNPEQIGDDPYGVSWLIKVKIQDASELDDTMTAEVYRQMVEGS